MRNHVVESRPVQRPPMHFNVYLALPVILATGFALWMLYRFIDWLSRNVGPFWSAHWGLIVTVGCVALLCACARPIWKAFKAFSNHKQEVLDRQADRQFRQATLQLMERGYNTKIVNARTGDVIELISPYTGKAQIALPETKVEEIAPPVFQQIAAPSADAFHISEEYEVPADDFLSGRKLIVGLSGTGKSNSIGTYGEELGRLRVPFLIADTENEYQPLCDARYLHNGLLAGAQNVNVDTSYQFGRYVLEARLQVILNLQSYDKMEEAAKVMIGIVSGMRDWQEERDNENRIPCDFILEEAVTWLPQNIKESPLYGTDELNMLQGTFFNDMVRKGRKRGLGLTLVCQKIAEIDKRALQTDGKILHYQNEGPDLACYEKMGIAREETLSLQKGDAFLFTSRVSKKRVHIRRRSSPHGANTPGLENLRRQENEVRSFGNIPETPWRNPEISDTNYTSFGVPTERIRNISDFPSPGAKTPQRGIPDETRNEIIELYKNGVNRTQIQERLRIAGDQYWQLRDICDQVDRVQREEKV
jgi:hypothetical protein